MSIDVINKISEIELRKADGTIKNIPLIKDIFEPIIDGSINVLSEADLSEVTTIGYGAFAVTDITSVTLPDNIVDIKDRAFFNCSSLKEINYNIPNLETPLTISSRIFSDGGAGNDSEITVNIGANVEKIPNYLFGVLSASYSAKIVTVKFAEDSICSVIGSNAFLRCEHLKSITIPESVTDIGVSTFSDCTGLTSINIPENVTHIGNSAFKNCEYLTEINFNVKNLSTALTLNSKIFYGAGIADTGITVNVGANVTSIPDYLFHTGDATNVANITSVNFEKPSKCLSIGNYAFTNCKITNIEIPEGVTTIEPYAFQGCSSLAKVVLPSTITSISPYSFSSVLGMNRCPITELITLSTTPPTLTALLVPTTAMIYIPKGTLETYTTAWSKQSASQFVELNEDGSKPD